MTEPRWLEGEEVRAWRGYRRMHTLLDLQIARDLARESGLSDADYDVLSTLSETKGHRLRMTELAAHILWSSSRLSHQIARMQRRGLVTREGSPSDARGAVVALSPAGWEAIRDAAPSHVESVRRHLIDVLTPAQLTALADIADTVVANLRRS